VAGFDARNVARISGSSRTRDEDLVTSEEALTISLSNDDHGLHNIGVTMRTRGDDTNLVLGFLYSEGIIDSIDHVIGVETDDESVSVSLGRGSSFDPSIHCRPSTVTSACGICGRSTIDDALHMHAPELSEEFRMSMNTVAQCLDSMRAGQKLFAKTGGSHACATFDQHGVMHRIYEDVGRHNAMDKLVGSYVSDSMVPACGLASFVSGRASFELVQKSIRAGFPIMVSIGAPTTLAVDLANEHGMTLICFAKNDSLTIYSGVRRVDN
tara:strand:- start:635 stop:1438 length:804 start_codon:yes stop_codon:yes gene_type:complete